jgi:hypothetical protein
LTIAGPAASRAFTSLPLSTIPASFSSWPSLIVSLRIAISWTIARI